MNPPPAPSQPPPIPAALLKQSLPKPALSPEQTLRKLFLTLFLRGHSARGLQKSGAPTSVAQKLTLALVSYVVIGGVVAGWCLFTGQPIFAMSLYLHGMNFMFLGMFVAASAGEVLFNQQEADILLHRPVSPRALLWAKIAVLLQVTLWLAGAFNLTGLVAGALVPEGGWRYPVVHVASTVLEALFCTGTVVLVYQLCLRWFGRERLDSLMTTVQVVLAIVMVAGGQIVPRLVVRSGGTTHLTNDSWWLALLPPAWFAGLDDALAGRGTLNSWLMAALGLAGTAIILWLAFGKLAEDYLAGLQTIGETAARHPQQRGRQRWLGRLVAAPPLCWWVRDSVSRASFQLTVAYLVRDRDMKLRIYPGIAPMLVMPVVMLMQGHGMRGAAAHGMGGFGIAFTGAYLGLVPMLALGMLQYSQHWQAADLFRVAPQLGPAALFHGARQAVLLFLALPLTVFFGIVAWLMVGTDGWSLLLLLPGVIVLPLYSLIPGLGGQAIPLSQPIESAKAAGRGVRMIGVMFFSMALAGLATAAWYFHFFAWFLLAEVLVAAGVYVVMRRMVDASHWPSLE